MTKLTKNFTSAELECPCCGAVEMNRFFMTALQTLRDDVGVPLYISSGFRCEKHNKKVKGANKSKHLIGMAVDIALDSLSSENIHDLIYYISSFSEREATKDLGFTGMGIYSKHIHFDLRYDKNAAWVSI